MLAEFATLSLLQSISFPMFFPLYVIVYVLISAVVSLSAVMMMFGSMVHLSRSRISVPLIVISDFVASLLVTILSVDSGM